MVIARNYGHILWRVPSLIIWMTAMPLVFIVARACKIPNHTRIPHVFHHGVRVILGLKVQFSGEVSKSKPTLFVSNHISYLDVFVLGNIPAFFVAKSEVAGWPVLGHFAKYQNTLFIERSAGKTRQSLQTMKSHIREGNSLILFPEGTSTDGVHVKPFKSSLFEAVNLKSDSQPNKDDLNRASIQPLTIAYTHQNGNKMGQTMLDYYAWYNEMQFLPHFLNLFALKNVDVKVHVHPVCYLDDFETRKQCAEYCQALVAAKLDEFLSEG
ncbi:MAG: 1-acyl-sn-glycerol-3-phosphate acyltransferase [Acidiferrobacterales bacterium]|nr:1-acyl-sn-glycerol-3-phosphate acyltransferase [Acidiferrobacterales bacterium]